MPMWARSFLPSYSCSTSLDTSCTSQYLSCGYACMYSDLLPDNCLKAWNSEVQQCKSFWKIHRSLGYTLSYRFFPTSGHGLVPDCRDERDMSVSDVNFVKKFNYYLSVGTSLKYCGTQSVQLDFQSILPVLHYNEVNWFRVCRVLAEDGQSSASQCVAKWSNLIPKEFQRLTWLSFACLCHECALSYTKTKHNEETTHNTLSWVKCQDLSQSPTF